MDKRIQIHNNYYTNNQGSIMKTLPSLIILIIVLFSPRNFAQTYIEVDPLAYAFNGHSLHIGYQVKGFRIQLGSFSAEYPDFMKENKSFNIDQSGFGVKFDYYGKNPEGVFIGLEYGITKMKYSLSGSQTIEKDQNLLGLRTGYKMKFGKCFYLMPWVGLDRNLSDTSKISINNEEYTPQKWVVFPTVHIGFDF